MTTSQPSGSTHPGRRLTGWLLASVVFIGAIAPLATDMYVPAFPGVAADLGTSAFPVQLTLTTFFVGMALGQLIGGPVSDQRGRRLPLLASLAVLVAASLACAAAPSITVMMLARFVQGFSGGWAMVIARSVVVDLSSGAELVRAMNLLAGVGGIAPVVGPLLGAAILQSFGWRTTFLAVAGLAAAMIVVVALAIPETLPAERRHGGGLTRLAASTKAVLSHRGYVGYLIVMAFSMGVTFAYVATSAFVLQSMNGLSPILYSVAFATNAVGLMAGTLTAGWLVGRVRTRAVIAVGLFATGAAGLAILAGALWWGMPLAISLGGFFLLQTAQGLVGPNAGALASSEVPEHPGTGSAVLGFLQWCMAGLIAPLAGLGGDRSAVPMAVIVLVLTAGSLLALLVVARPRPTT
ncbi:multidrug effflux MFS transporter [Propionicimonas sp.]|uniref:multidrug effflux MFS transporter n=1 Tax=Propionicimonas sp. TaxID=1955623 RepID=UPI0039E4A3C4